jgi:probable F420-dependent oxidoreductase
MGTQRLRGIAAGRFGVFAGPLNDKPSEAQREFAVEMERLGYGTLWVGESLGQEIFGRSAMLLAATDRLVVASGIANIWARDPTAMANGGRTLADAWPNRFILGIGVSHRPTVSARGHDYDRPYSAMQSYLAAMAEATYRGPKADLPPLILAALGPRMAALAADKTAGAYPYFTTVDHVREVRGILGAEPFLAVDLPIVLAEDLAGARAAGNRHLAFYLRSENYRKNLLRLGWTEAQLEPPGSDELFEAIVAWGDLERIRRQTQLRFDAGADQVVFNLIGPDPAVLPLRELNALAPLVRGG